MKLFTDLVESIDLITEDIDGKKSYSIKGIFMQGNIRNRNGRMYPVPILEKEVGRYVNDYVAKKRAFGELGHPSGPTINMERVSHMITELKRDGDNFVGKAKILDTPYGAIVKSLMNEGATLGVSSRGIGTLKERNGIQEVQDDFYLATAADIVADPSAPGAFVQGIMENKEWVYESGAFREADLETAKRIINQAARSKENLEQKQIEVFETFISALSSRKITK